MLNSEIKDSINTFLEKKVDEEEEKNPILNIKEYAQNLMIMHDTLDESSLLMNSITNN